jgi:hypothetical protein
MPTATTLPLLLLVLVLWRVTKGELLSIVLFLSIFQAASGLDLGTMGLAPWILTLVIGLLMKLVRPRAAPFNTLNTNVIAVRLLMVFVCYAIFSGLVYPLIFHGVAVQGSHDSSPGPLAFGIANIAQILYLLTAVAAFVLALLSSREALSSALDWYVRGCIVACFFAIYQLANAVLGVPYPSAVLYSNPRYVIYPAYMIDGMWRLNSTFTEASSLAGHLSVGIALLGWNVVTGPLRWRSSLSLVLMVVTLLFTLSSSGYLSMILMVLAGAILSLRTLLRERSLSRGKALLMLLGVSVIMVALITTNATATINKAIHSVLLDKEQSRSYRERTASNFAAMETARETYYMGAGWGSVRCSSLGPGLLATVGIAGTLLFCTFLLSLTLPLFGAGRNIRSEDIYEKSLLGTFMILAAMMVAGNEPDQPILWVLFAACAAGPSTYRVMREGIEARQRSAALHHPVRSL